MLITMAGAVSFRRPPRHASVLEISDDECFEDDEGFLDWLDESEARISPALYSHSDLPTPRSSSIILPRNPPIATPFLSLDDFTYNGIRLHPRVFVELQDGDFMKIVHIVKDGRSSEVTIRGWIFRRTRKTNGMFNSKRNEVCWIIYIDDDDPRDHGIQSLESRLVTEVVKRRQIRLTNQPFPALSYRDDRINESDKAIESVRVLVCRYKYFIFYPNAKARTSSHPWSEKVVRRLRADECDQRPDNNIKDEDLRTDSRGDTIPGGAQEGWLPGEKEYLRQEGVSHQGINACQSLRGPFGLDYPAGDLMTRGSVGRLLTKHDLDHKSATSGTALNRTIPHRTRCRSTLNFAFSDHSSSTIAAPSMASPTRASIGSNHNNAVVIASSDSDDEVDMVNTPRRPKACNKRKRPQAFTFDEDYDVSDQETCDDPAIILDLTKSLRKSSIQPPRQRQKTSKIIKTNAEVKIKTDFIDLSKVSMDSASSRKPTTLAALQSIPRFAPKLSSRTLVSSRNFLLTPRPRSPARTFPFRRYTFGDCFCGAGGMSRGAINAGLRIAWGFDFNLAACQTFQLNFLGTPVYNVWANDFSNCKKDFKVDICHMSPPCQFFSPAHTSHGKDDDMNTASLFAIEALLKKVTPRVVTLEETAGLVRTRVHEIYFNVVINMFTSQGFSVRWKVVNCADFGVPERRMRLVIIASW